MGKMITFWVLAILSLAILCGIIYGGVRLVFYIIERGKKNRLF